MKERNVLIDFIKGISILLMVMAHSCPPQLLKNIVYLFHIGLFYYASGWLFNEDYLNSPLSFVKRKLKGLYIPYVKWGLFYFLLVNIMSLILFGSVDQNLKNVADILLFRNVHLLISPLWFLKSLFISEMFFFCILYFFRKRTTILLLIMLLLFTMGWYCSHYDIYLPFGINRELVTMFVLFLGYFSKKHTYYDGLVARKPKVIAIVLFCCTVLLFVGALYRIRIDTMSCTFSYWAIYPFFTLIGVIFLSCIHYYLFKIVDARNIIYRIASLLSKCSLSILALHFTCFMLLSIVLDFCCVDKELNLSNGFVYSSRFWWLYSIIGIVFPLAWVKLYNIMLDKSKTAFQLYRIKL